jgi:hypothetical protein
VVGSASVELAVLACVGHRSKDRWPAGEGAVVVLYKLILEFVVMCVGLVMIAGVFLWRQ